MTNEGNIHSESGYVVLDAGLVYDTENNNDTTEIHNITNSGNIIANSGDKEGLKKSIQSFAAVVKVKQQEFQRLGEKALAAMAMRGYSHDDFKLKFTKIFEKVATGTLDKITDAQAKHLTDTAEEWFNKGKATPALCSLATELQAIFVDIYNDHLTLKTLENKRDCLKNIFATMKKYFLFLFLA